MALRLANERAAQSAVADDVAGRDALLVALGALDGETIDRLKSAYAASSGTFGNLEVLANLDGQSTFLLENIATELTAIRQGMERLLAAMGGLSSTESLIEGKE